MCRSGKALFLTNEELLGLTTFLTNLELHVKECPAQTGYPAEICFKTIKDRWNRHNISGILRLVEEAVIQTRP